MPTSPLKRPSAGGRLGRLLSSLRPPARAGPLPVQTGFPTSLADIVVKNHGRLKNPRRRQRAASAGVGAGTLTPTAAEPVPVPQQRRELSVAHDAAAQAPAAAPVPARPRPRPRSRPGHGHGKGAGFSIRPGLLATGGAVTLALLVIWSRQLVAAATFASVALSWIDSVRIRTVRRRRRQETKEVADLRGRGRVSPIREAAAAAAAAEAPRPSSAGSASDNGSSEAASLWSADADNRKLGGGGDDEDSANNPKRKQKRRSLRKLLANKLRGNGRRPWDKDSRHGDEHEHPGAGKANAKPAAAEARAPAEEETPTAIAEDDDDERCHRPRGGALPLPAFMPIILVGLVAGKVPAVALAVLCGVFSSSTSAPIESVPVPGSGDLR